MITAITGVLTRVQDEEVRLQIGAFEYAVLVPEFVRRQIQTRLSEEVTLHTSHYLEGSQVSTRMVPRLIGFLSEAELEFFELFCTVDKIGMRKALKALVRPVREIAAAISQQDTKWLTSLPGIGQASADTIVTTLRKKVGRFAHLSEHVGSGEAPPAGSGQIIEDAYAALLSLGLNPIDARNRLDAVIGKGAAFTRVEEILTAVFGKG